MKIDKIVFCCSEEFSPFWNLQSFLWKEKLDIDPVCLLGGKLMTPTTFSCISNIGRCYK